MIKGKEKFPTLITKRLVCRQLTIDDAEILHQYWSDVDVTEFMSLDPFKTIEEGLDGRLQEKKMTRSLVPAAFITISRSIFGPKWVMSLAENIGIRVS